MASRWIATVTMLHAPVSPSSCAVALDVAHDQRRRPAWPGSRWPLTSSAGLLGGQAGGPLEHQPSRLLEVGQLLAAGSDLRVPLGDLAGTLLEVTELGVEALLALTDAVLALLEVQALGPDVLANTPSCMALPTTA